MRLRLGKYNTLRNQILFVFLSVMVIVLCFVGIMTYNIVSSLLKNNGEKQIQQTAIEANGRMESLYQQIDMLTKQVATNSYVQQLLLSEKQGQYANFIERQALMQVGNTFQVYSDGINAFELYSTNYRKLIPLDEDGLFHRVDNRWIEAADQAEGKLVWIGKDPNEPEFFLAIRRVSLMDRWFTNGGYLLVQIHAKYFEFTETSKDHGEYMILVDQNNKAITSNYKGEIGPIISKNETMISFNGNDYMLVKQKSSITGWTLHILTPVSTIMEGISVLRAAIILSGAFGFLIFVICSVFLSTMITNPILKLTKTMKKSEGGELTLNPEIASTIEINELNQTYNHLVEHTNHLIQVVYEKEIVNSQAELKALQSQINPHFLFNTLDALYWSLDEKGEDELADSVIAMSELFRYTISSHNQDEWVTLKQELEHVEMYMQLMEMRFGERFTWSVDIPSDYESVKIPKLIIQPIVENAILHGVGNKHGKGFVTVSVKPSPSTSNLIILVKDNGPGMDQVTIDKIMTKIEAGKVTSLKGNGMAIANVNKRLQLYYKEYEISRIAINSIVNEGTCFTFEVPINGGIF
ncbi:MULTISPECIES: cache domain-containing sensor histidine kinase [Metabacillus]|uniref:Histidine kinase n=2 Tax=Metabacillus TaxID=2675233 RepID=A0A179SZZ6_9BACI|nr:MULTISPECIES: sensor histidine kinase [Metabacillus]OAS86828.1 histidine kinase [Metabacillus litoralis]QNF29099.1 sensor histidine kinase [Metabacillus sp. KUDC1714]